jgi:hypothetical protein
MSAVTAIMAKHVKLSCVIIIMLNVFLAPSHKFAGHAVKL